MASPPSLKKCCVCESHSSKVTPPSTHKAHECTETQIYHIIVPTRVTHSLCIHVFHTRYQPCATVFHYVAIFFLISLNMVMILIGFVY